MWKITIHACCHLRTVVSHGLNVPNHDGELRLQNCLPNALNMKYDKEQKYNKPHTNKNIRKNFHIPNIVGSIHIYIYIYKCCAICVSVEEIYIYKCCAMC